MITRRKFLKTAAASTAATPLAENAGATPDERSADRSRRPLRAEPRRRIIFAKSAPNGALRLYSDGSPDPRPLIRTEALEREFGKGIEQSLRQPDHWRMIDEGWFKGDELFELNDLGSWSYAVWKANYHPECEAHDLLFEFFRSGMFPGGGINKEFDLAFSEHPCTPRFATVTLLNENRLTKLATRVAALTEWVSIARDAWGSDG
ncbi:twin-arginine translocation signal domain-containing protein [Actibacterium pelagium]|uniref:Twin-arginine translocation signal domain-containing protein n=1 Tax=Actibacterium pelagium TaxID=2029103 RepID=A0A917AJB3_9RHOB|nr:twin-arginine translocation signal domain-containing protein [Actibacterium pelagium]GGE57447.1 hypothetical protein GCM10011517_26550 [Actibacterium pelagium]